MAAKCGLAGLDNGFRAVGDLQFRENGRDIELPSGCLASTPIRERRGRASLSGCGLAVSVERVLLALPPYRGDHVYLGRGGPPRGGPGGGGGGRGGGRAAGLAWGLALGGGGGRGG